MFRPHPLLDLKVAISPADSVDKTLKLLAPNYGNLETNSLRIERKSRISSLMSLHSDKESNAGETNQYERASLRLLARSYASRRILRRPYTTASNSGTIYSNQGTDSFRRKERGKRFHNYHTSFKRSLFSNTEDELAATHINTNTRDRITEFGFYDRTDTQAKYASNSSDKENIDVAPTRFVVLRNVPLSDKCSILSQVCGGPLERISTVACSKDHEDASAIQLCFMRLSDAENFYRYSNSGLFIINGVRIMTNFGSYTTEDQTDTLSESIKNEVLSQGARRCLILKRSVKNSQKFLIKHEDHSKQMLADLDVKQVRADFSKYGEIIDIAAVVSKKLSFAVHYCDVRSSIMAKRELNSVGTELNKKYSSWTVWYGKDPCDRPCYIA